MASNLSSGEWRERSIRSELGVSTFPTNIPYERRSGYELQIKFPNNLIVYIMIEWCIIHKIPIHIGYDMMIYDMVRYHNDMIFCIYIYIYTYTHTYTYAYTWIHISTHIYIYIYHTHIYIYNIHICISTSISILYIHIHWIHT